MVKYLIFWYDISTFIWQFHFCGKCNICSLHFVLLLVLNWVHIMKGVVQPFHGMKPQDKVKRQEIIKSAQDCESNENIREVIWSS